MPLQNHTQIGFVAPSQQSKLPAGCDAGSQVFLFPLPFPHCKSPHTCWAPATRPTVASWRFPERRMPNQGWPPTAGLAALQWATAAESSAAAEDGCKRKKSRANQMAQLKILFYVLSIEDIMRSKWRENKQKKEFPAKKVGRSITNAKNFLFTNSLS